MELRLFAEQVLMESDLDRKLQDPGLEWTDESPGEACRPPYPARPDGLSFCDRKQAPAMPHPNTFGDPKRRAIAHHIMANHELQALEIMASILLGFPEAPTGFRRGLAAIMRDEQRHTRLHIARSAELGLTFGSLPVNGYFWSKSLEFKSVLDYLAGLPLTFEGRNLDHTIEFEDWFEQAGDPRSAGIMRAIHRDEIQHVAFGLEWLRRLKPPEMSDWEAYTQHLHWPLRAGKSRGKQLHVAPREAAGMTREFIEQLQREEIADPPRPRPNS